MLNRKGQNIAEYSILIALVIAAAVAMQTYVKRGIQGRVADATDYAPVNMTVENELFSFNTKQYEPYYLQSAADVTTNRVLHEDVASRGGITHTGMTEESKRIAGSYEGSTWNDFNADQDR